MVTRTIEAYDNELLTVASGSPSLRPGSAIINNSDSPDGTIYEFSGGAPVTVTLEDTSANQDVFNDDDYGNHRITDGAGLVDTGKGVEAESLFYMRALDNCGNPTGPTITVRVYSQDNNYGNVWGFNSDTPLEAGTQYVKVAGSNTGSASYSSFTADPVCYAEGTLIDTPDGPVPVELLKPDDLVWTFDHGPVPVKWVRSEAHQLSMTAADKKPILISAGALGAGLPDRDLVVSPQHRILVGGHGQLQDLFPSEAYVPAKSLTALKGIRQMKGKKAINWVHFACERHEVVMANGCLSESLLLGPMVLRSMTAHDRSAMTKIFGLAKPHDLALNGPLARDCLSVGAARRQIAKGLKARKQRQDDAIRKWDEDAALEKREAALMRDIRAMDRPGLKSVA